MNNKLRAEELYEKAMNMSKEQLIAIIVSLLYKSPDYIKDMEIAELKSQLAGLRSHKK